MIEYYATDAFGNTIYLDVESIILYKFSPEEIKEGRYLLLDSKKSLNKSSFIILYFAEVFQDS